MHYEYHLLGHVTVDSETEMVLDVRQFSSHGVVMPPCGRLSAMPKLVVL